MRRKQLEGRKHPPSTRPSPITQDIYERESFSDARPPDNRTLPEDIREQLRLCLQELEHHRLTSDLQVQKRVLLEQQLKTARQELEQQRQEKQQLKKELVKLSKKYGKAKEKKDCEKCKQVADLTAKLDKEREVYFNQRKMLQEEIKAVRIQLESSQALQERQKLLVLADSLKKEIYLAGKKIDQQARIIHFLNDKLSHFEVENVQIMNNVELLENKLSEIEIDTAIRNKHNRQCPNCSPRNQPNNTDLLDNTSYSLAKRRRNGSIQNIKRTGDSLERYQ